jgi:hypothetical protein
MRNLADILAVLRLGKYPCPDLFQLGHRDGPLDAIFADGTRTPLDDAIRWFSLGHAASPSDDMI